MSKKVEFVRQTGGKGKFGHVYVRLEPLDVEAAGKEYEFAEEVVGGVVPKEFFGAVDKGIQERMKNGVLAGYPVVGVKAVLLTVLTTMSTLTNCRSKWLVLTHSVMVFMKADPVLLEPIMKS